MANNLTSPLLNDSEEDLAVLERRRSSAVFDFEVPEMLLQSMEVYNHPSGYPVTISEMSENHKVLLVFLRHLDCIFCQVTVAKLAVHYKALLQLNTIPVLVHQELKEVADEHFATFQGFKQYQPIVDQMLRVEDLTGTHYYKQFNLGSVGTKNAPLVPTILSARRYTVKGFRNSLFPKDKRADRDQMPGIFLVENGRIINLFQYKTIIDEPLFLELVIDVERSGYGTEATCDLTCTIEKEVLPRKILDEETEDFTENLLTADEDDLLSSTFNTDIYQTHLLAGLDPFLLEEKTKKKKRKFSSICCVCCFVSTADEDISSDLREGILLTEVLSNSDARRYYKLFSAKELSLENVLFWEAVTEYKSTFHHMTHTAQETMAKQIIRTFFTLSSPNELNISSRQKSTTIDLLQKQGPTVALFDSILSNVLSDQMSDTFARFKKTEIFIDEVSRSLLSSSR